jgi:hypothetical protein
MRQALIAAFKSKTLALIDTLHLKHNEVVGLALSLAASYALIGGISRQHLVDALVKSMDAAEAKLPGIVDVGGANAEN